MNLVKHKKNDRMYACFDNQIITFPALYVQNPIIQKSRKWLSFLNTF